MPKIKKPATTTTTEPTKPATETPKPAKPAKAKGAKKPPTTDPKPVPPVVEPAPTPAPAVVPPVVIEPPAPVAPSDGGDVEGRIYEATKEKPETTTTKPAPSAKAKTVPAKLGAPFVKVLTALKDGKPKTRAAISEASGVTSGFTSLLGHLDPAKREPQSLAARGYIKPETEDRDGKTVIVWTITAAGQKALAEAAAK